MTIIQSFPDQPVILCKYRDWSNLYHRTILTKRELYFAPPSSFEDVTDCRNDNVDFSEYEREINFRELDKRCGVLSMTKNQNNSKLWEEYADNYRGFLVAFDGRMLCSLFSGCGDITYYNELPPIKYSREQPIEEYIYHKYFAKSKQYMHEQEFRLVNVNLNGLSGEQRKVKVPIEAYKYIKIGKNMPETFRKELINSIPVELKTIPIFQ